MIIEPDWQVPTHIRACTTIRSFEGDFSQGPYLGLNVAAHVGDDAARVVSNRDFLCNSLDLKSSPTWLSQIHSNRVVNVAYAQQNEEADAQFAVKEGVCAVMTADCLPVLLADQRGRVIAAAHAGWRGLAGGILESTVASMDEVPHKIHAWLGPAISQSHFQVGADVRGAFIEAQTSSACCFKEDGIPGKWLADIYQLARMRLQSLGIRHITGGDYCTYAQQDLFYSYRRDGVTGRMASLIWFVE